MSSAFECISYQEFIIIKSENKQDLIVLADAIRKQLSIFVENVITSSNEVLVKLDSSKIEDLTQFVLRFEDQKLTSNIEPASYRIPVCFLPHDDWSLVLNYTSIAKNDYIQKLCEQIFTVEMLGFLPGFFYMNGLDSDLKVPRKEKPSSRIASNTLAVGGDYLGFYSLPSPAGWYALGRCPINMLNLRADPPMEISVNDTIKIEAIHWKKYQEIINQEISLKEYNGIT